MDAARRGLEEAKAEVQAVQREVGAQRLEARVLALPLRRNERLVQKLLAAADGTYAAEASEAELAESLAESEAMTESLRAAAAKLAAGFPHLAPQIQAAMASAQGS